MNHRKALNTYTQQQITTSSPVQTVVMVYDMVLSSLEEALDAISKKEFERRWKANKRAMDLITHMQNTLDMEKGGEVAENLFRLYTTLLFMLPDVDIKNSPEPIHFAIRLLTPLRDAWQELNNRIASGEIDPQTEIQQALLQQQQAPQTEGRLVRHAVYNTSAEEASDGPGALMGAEMVNSFATTV